MQTGTMENLQTITTGGIAAGELVSFTVYKATAPKVWTYFFSDDRLKIFRIGSERSHQYNLTLCERAIAYNPITQQFTLIKDRFPSGGKFNRNLLVSYCKEFLDCDVDMNGNWINSEDATFFHLKWAGQPNHSY